MLIAPKIEFRFTVDRCRNTLRITTSADGPNLHQKTIKLNTSTYIFKFLYVKNCLNWFFIFVVNPWITLLFQELPILDRSLLPNRSDIWVDALIAVHFDGLLLNQMRIVLASAKAVKHVAPSLHHGPAVVQT